MTAARVAPDGQTIVYAAAWQGAAGRLYSTRVGSRESTLLDLPPGNIASISSTGELAILRQEGETLARVPLSGGAPRDLTTGVRYADWSPDGKSLAIVRGKGRLEYPIGKLLIEAEAIDFVRVSPQGDRVAFFGTDAEGLATVELADRAGGRKVLSTGWAWTRGLAWSPSSEEIWFTAKRVGERPGWFIPLYAVNLSGRQRLLMSLPAWTSLEDLSHEGRLLMILGSRQNEMFGRVPGAPQEQDLAWNESSWAIDLSQDGRKLLFQEFAEELYREEGGGLYVRGTDGSPAVRIGQGYPGTLSPDGKQVAVCPPESQRRDRVQIIPVGAGETRTLELAGVTCQMVQWFPDGRKLLIRGERSGERIREYLVDTEQGTPRPVTPEGTICISGSIFPNGRELACREAQGPQGVGFVYPVDGGEPRAVRGLMPGDRINGVRDDRTLSLERDGPRPGGWPAQLFWLDLATGRRTLFLELQPADPTGVLTMSLVATRDFRSYVYSYDREVNALYFVDGLR